MVLDDWHDLTNWLSFSFHFSFHFKSSSRATQHNRHIFCSDTHFTRHMDGLNSFWVTFAVIQIVLGTFFQYFFVVINLLLIAILLYSVFYSFKSQPNEDRSARRALTKALARKIAAKVIAEMSLSSVSDEEIIRLLKAGTRLLDEEPARVSVDAPCYIFGDLHGNLPYFLKYFKVGNVEPQLLKLRAPENNLLFLGDYVDRGQFSLEVIVLLVALKLLFPYKITLLRGNHEIMEINQSYSFYGEVCEKRMDFERIYTKCNKLFTKLPLCAVVSDTYLCMHGGLPRPEGWDFLMGDEFEKPQNDEEIDSNYTFCDLLWADPTNNSRQLPLFEECEPDDGFLEEYANYRFNEDRETSIQFNDRFAQEFFNRFPNIRGVFRAHEQYPQGHGMNEARTICTIFSSPRYMDEADCGSVLNVSADLKRIHFVTLKPKV
uniref:Serine/threonine-protein phosphatase n=1 Tax=Globodera rostochiensis TaxID=31243 RepID=A0A914IGQ6_GLORO